MTGIELIAKERQRQIADSRFDSEHDDRLQHHELLDMAEERMESLLADPIPQLCAAGALIAAEIDRLQRRKEKGVA